MDQSAKVIPLKRDELPLQSGMLSKGQKRFLVEGPIFLFQKRQEHLEGLITVDIPVRDEFAVVVEHDPPQKL